MRYAVVGLTLALCATTVAEAAAALPVSPAWPTPGGSPARTNEHVSTDVRHPVKIWRRWGQTSGRGRVIEHGVTVAGGRVYGVTIAGTHFAFSALNGSVIWRRDYGRAFATAPTYQGRMLYVNGRRPGRLWKLRADTGTVVWSRRVIAGVTTAESEGAPLVVRRRVFVTTSRGGGAYLLAFSARTGRRLWARRLCVLSWQAPTWTGRRVVVGDYCGILRAFTPRGRRVWANDLVGASYAATNYRRGAIYASTKLGRLYKLSARSGRTKWVASTGGSEAFGECAVSRTRVFCPNLDGTVSAFAVRGGRVIWRRHFGERIYGACVLTRGMLWVALHDSKQIVALGPRQGRVRFRWGSGRYDPAAAWGETLYLVGHVSVSAWREGA
jgi:outer membrane protein assembly factor BamB